MKKSRINPISKKQRIRNKLWAEITDQLCLELKYTCQYCGKLGQRDNLGNLWTYLDGHHIFKRSRGRLDTKENCYPCHRHCHEEIERKNIVVSLGDYKDRELF